VLASSAILLTGCSVARIATHEPVSNPAPSPTALKSAPIRGKVHGGQQPIQGASVYLFALAAGNGPQSASLLTGTGNTDGSNRSFVTTNSTGGFTITSDEYSCGSPTAQQVYLYSVGGTAGFGPNSAAGLMAVLGQCSGNAFTGLPSSIQMNEVTTVAAAYALAGFATDAADMAGSNTALAATGMANAALSAFNLANLGTGLALTTTPAGNGTVPQSEIDTLADILAACINSSGPGSSGCTTLFSNAKNGATAPTDTATAAINIAHNPGANVGSLFGLSTSTAPFQPSLSGAPNDWTIAVTYTGGGLGQSDGIAIDDSGNVWAANENDSTISEFSSSGAALSGSGGYTGGGLSSPYGIAIDATGNVWVTNAGGNSISEFDSSGNPLSGSGITGGGLSSPVHIAIDASGNVWTADSGNASIAEYDPSTSTFLSPDGTGDTGGGLSNPYGIAVDVSGNVWVANSGKVNSVSEFNSAGTASGSSPYTGGGLADPLGVAVDHSGNVWVVNIEGNSFTVFNSSGTIISGANGYGAYQVGGLWAPDSVAIDGSGNVWAANQNSNCISELSSSGNAITPSTGYEAGLEDPTTIVIDGSGNVWTTSFNNQTLTEFVGAATPVVTPLAVGVANSELGTRP
jgi:streptogramin lyase